MAKTYRRRGLTGGASGSLDALDGAPLANGDVAIVYDPVSGATLFYNLDAASGAAEESPSIISPNANAGTKRWLLTKSICTDQMVTELAGDGDIIIVDTEGNLTNSGVTIDAIKSSTNKDADTRLISGGATVWKSGYTYTVSSAVYMIKGSTKSSSGGDITLDAAHATLDRIDNICLTSDGVVSKVTGTPASSPQKPYVDPSSALDLTWVYVQASSSGAATEVAIYKEGTAGEWSISVSSETVFTVGSTAAAHAGTKSIEGTTIPQGAWVFGVAGSPFVLADQEILAFYVKLKASWTNEYIKLAWFLDTTWIGNYVYIMDGTYGFDTSNTNDWQLIVIPILNFGAGAGITADRLAIYFESDLGGGTGLYIDDIVLQAGVGSVSEASQSLRPRGEWNATTLYLMNDTVTYIGNTYYCMYPCYGNVFPAGATNSWALLSEGGVQGPATNSDNVVPRYDGANSNTLQTSLATIDDSGTVNIPSGQTYNINGSPHTHSGSGDGGVGLTFEATAKPTSNGIYHVILPYSMTVPADFSGSGFFNATNPSAQVVITIQKNGSSIGTCTVSTGGVATWSCSETAFSSGNIITFVFPAQDSTWAGIAITVKGVRA